MYPAGKKLFFLERGEGSATKDKACVLSEHGWVEIRGAETENPSRSENAVQTSLRSKRRFLPGQTSDTQQRPDEVGRNEDDRVGTAAGRAGESEPWTSKSFFGEKGAPKNNDILLKR